MSDMELVARVRERKTAELMMYAGLVKYEPDRRGFFVDVIDILSSQLDACDRLLEGSEEKQEAEKIVNPEYRGRLSESELSDEDTFNSYLIHPVNQADNDLSEYIIGLMDKAQEIRSVKEANAEAVQSLKEELKSCRERIDMLAGKLEFVQEENSALTDENNEIRSQLEMLSSKPAAAGPELPDTDWVDDELVPISELLDQIVESQSDDPQFYLTRLTEAKDTIQQILDRLGQDIGACGLGALDEVLGKVYVLKASVDITDLLLRSQECPEPSEDENAEEPPAEDDGFYEQILTEDELQLLSLVQVMKSSKIDYFVDMALSGRFNENACDDVVDFLKVDLSIIRSLLSMDYHDRQSIEDNFASILEILGDASEPKHQKMYVNSLTPQERVMEDTYNKILARVQSIMLARYSDAEE